MLRTRSIEVIGVRSYSFTGNDGKDIYMSQVFGTYHDDKTEGKAALSFSVPERKIVEDAIVVGKAVSVAYVADKQKWEYVSIK